MNRMFVYGTLKRGQRNHGLLEDEQNGKAEFISNGATAEQYILVVDPDFGIPFILDSGDDGKNIEGEIWDVDDAMLRKLDQLEMHPEFYTRLEKEITVSGDTDSKTTTICWVYILRDFNPKLLAYDHMSSFTMSNYIPHADRKEFNYQSFKI